ncbi:MAG TPA: PH domain-containing protein [Acidimicrobiia bacterium]|nr:PH domain-containing protein [Acidimicrobiia bacterium]
MAYPEKLLSPGEQIMSEFRPHWSGIVKEAILSILALVLIVLIAVQGFSWGLWAIGALILIWLILVARGFIRWFTTQHVITTERVIHRLGLVSKQGKEIPLEVINDVAFNQSAWERIFGTGDLLIESAGTHGQSKYTDIPNPEAIQSLIYQVREDRQRALQSRGGPAVESSASQLATLSRLHDEGKLSDVEFEAEKQKLLGGA